MAGSGHEREAGVGERAGEGASVRGSDDAITVAPEHQGRHLDPSQTAEQGRVVHVWVASDETQGGHIGALERHLLRGEGGRVDVEAVGVVVGILGDAAGVEGEEVADRLSCDLHAAGIDEDKARDTAALVAQGHLAGDPSTEGGADYHDVAEIFVLE